jgi:predicted nucleic acid-binding protein
VTTLYLDTSSLLKLYVGEDGSDDVRQDLSDCSAGATSAVAYVEARAAFARRRREGTLTAAAFRSATRDFEEDWPRYLVVEPTLALCREAGQLAERHALRGFDGLHLAAFLQIVRDTPSSDVRFSSFDRALNRAAARASRSARRSATAGHYDSSRV